jgi:hypothetical protein
MIVPLVNFSRMNGSFIPASKRDTALASNSIGVLPNAGVDWCVALLAR